MRILLKGYYGFGNLGDDILMLVSFNLLKSQYPGAEITIFSNNTINNKDANTVEGYNNYISTILGEKVKIIDWTYHGHFDLIFHGGGGVYFDNRKGSVIYFIANYFLRLIGIQVAYKLDKILRKIFSKPEHIHFSTKIGVGIGAGPFHPYAKLFYQKITELGSYDKLSVRDHFSFDLLKSLKFNGLLNQNTDLSFLTNLWMLNQNIYNTQKDDRKIGIILKGSTKEIHLYYKKLAKELEAKKINIEFFAFDESYDQDYIRRMAPEFEVNIWQPNRSSIDGYLSKLWTCSICITDRAHGAILGAIGNVIPLIIRTSQKSDQIISILKLDSILAQFNNTEFYNIDDIFKVFQEQDRLTKKLNLIVKKEAKGMYEYINTMISP